VCVCEWVKVSQDRACVRGRMCVGLREHPNFKMKSVCERVDEIEREREGQCFNVCVCV